jgi:uncharacterized RDD family membrane protein YckC
VSGEVWQVVVFDDGGDGWSWRALGRDGLPIIASETRHATQKGAEEQARALYPTAEIVGAGGLASATAASPTATYPTPYPRAASLAEESALADPADPLAKVELASWGRRAAALLLDGFVLFLGFMVLFAIALAVDPSFDETADPAAGDEVGVGWIVLILGMLLGPALYAWLMLGAWGQTLGKMALGIRVVRADDTNRIGYLRALGRVGSVWLLSLLYIPLLLSYLWPLWDSRNQTLQDKMASTVVIRT